MTDPKLEIKNVSDTALWVATYRNVESQRPDALFKDPYAGILAGEKGAQIAEKMGRLPGPNYTPNVIIVRTKILDEMILATIKEHSIDTVLNLAAGLDTRPYRLPLDSQFRWVEVDLPGIIEYKEQKLKEYKPVCRLERIVQDLRDDKGSQSLFSRINSESKNVLVMTEGLLIYLDESVVKNLAKDLRAQSHFKFWLFDYASPEGIQIIHQRMKSQLENAPMIFGVDPDMAFFKPFGWSRKEIRYFYDEGKNLNRLPKLNPVWAVMGLFLSREKKQMYRRMSGYAMLTPTSK